MVSPISTNTNNNGKCLDCHLVNNGENIGIFAIEFKLGINDQLILGAFQGFSVLLMILLDGIFFVVICFTKPCAVILEQLQKGFGRMEKELNGTASIGCAEYPSHFKHFWECVKLDGLLCTKPKSRSETR
ncbi:MAG: hypothetical protein OEY59_06680 [Deltaproteobacteria bacterium]|nr:hypothetical protein [Deltaproteobacteria bacterium]